MSEPIDSPRRVRLGNVCRLQSQTCQPMDRPHDPYVGLEHLDSGIPTLSRFGWGSDVTSAKTLFDLNDVLFGKLRPYLQKAVLAPLHGMCSTDILVLRPTDALLPEYLVNLTHFPAFTQHAVATTQGVNHPRTSWNALAEFEFVLPPLAEQRAIAHALRTVQAAGEARRREIALERERKAALMHRLFTHGTRNESTGDTDLGPLPESWRIATVGSLVRRNQYGLSVAGKASGLYPILRMNALIEGRVSDSGLQYVDLDDRTFESFRLHEGDILFNRTNSYELVGKTALFALEGPYVFASYLVRVEPDTLRAVPAYLNFYLNWGITQQRLKQLASRGVSQSNISASKLAAFVVPVPALDEQREIAGILGACDAKIAALERETALHDELFRAMLEELMSGRLQAPPLVVEGAT